MAKKLRNKSLSKVEKVAATLAFDDEFRDSKAMFSVPSELVYHHHGWKLDSIDGRYCTCALRPQPKITQHARLLKYSTVLSRHVECCMKPVL